MKLKLLTSLFFLFSVYIQAQITKSEAFLIGTKVAFYPNQCGNTIPEASGKLTFCDDLNNLGVVERSYGLSGRGVEQMLDNHYNQDEFYVTANGLSIRKADTTWENIPNISVPTYNGQGDWTNAATIKNGIVLPTGEVLVRATGGVPSVMYSYDLTTKTFNVINFPNNHYPYQFAYDSDRNITWILASSGGTSSHHLFSYDGNTLSEVSSISELSNQSIQVNTLKIIYKSDDLYLGTNRGLYKIDLTDYLNSNITTTQYDATNTSALPFNRTLDLQFDTGNNLWLAQSSDNGYDGAIINFDITNETYQMYQLVTDNPSVNYAFDNIAIDDSGFIYAGASNYSGIMELTFPGNIETWNTLSLQDLEILNVPMTYRPNDIYYKNNQFYFVTVDFSSSINTNYEVVINNNGNWSGRNDNKVGNISSAMNNRFTSNLPDDNGGMWWLNSSDDIIVYRNSNDEHEVMYLNNLLNSGVIDVDQKPIVSGGSPNKIRKVDLPLAYDFLSDNNQNVTQLKRYKDEVWWFNNSASELKILKQDQVFATFDLDNSYQSTFYFDVDSNGDAWFAKNQGGELIIKHFDLQTENTTDYLNPLIGQLRAVVAAPNNGMWFVGQIGLIYYNGLDFTTYFNTNHSELYNNANLVVDTNGIAYVLQKDAAAITKIENAGTPQVEFSITYLEGNNSILPALEHYRPNDLSIDSNGAIWTHASLNTFKLIDDDVATEYREEGESYTISGLVYNDVNENDSFDEGEEYPGQLVTLKINDEIYTTFTNTNGVYNFFLYEENTDYDIILPNISPFVTANNRRLLVNVGAVNQSYDGNDFQLKPRFVNSLLVKTSNKVGAWGFVRDNFENTFTSAIGNISTTKTYTNLELNYIFKNEDENSTNALPAIEEIKVYELDPNGSLQIIEKVTIDPISNSWSVGLDPNAYTQTELSVVPEITETGTQTNIGITIPTVSPLNTYIVEIKTGLFDPVSVGENIVFGYSSMESPDFEDQQNNPITVPIYLSPIQDRDDSVSDYPSNFPETPYIDPENVYSEPPYLEPKQVYSDPPYKAPIYSSYDPNDKLVDEGVANEINDRHIGRKWLTYTIRFENTGNFSAKDVVITDQLDDSLDPNSVMVVRASHDYEVDIFKNGQDNSILRFSFNDIFLPFDDANNDGYISFRVKANEDIAENTIVDNVAKIYFDQNPPIITNVIQVRFLTITSLSITDEVLDAEFKVYPNPSAAEVNIDSEIEIETIELYSILGKKIMNTNQRKLDVSKLNAGTYIIRIMTSKGTLSKKVIIN